MTDRVLIVDDEPDLCASFAEALEVHGFDADTASSAADAGRCVQRGDFGAVLLDIELGAGVTGLDLCREIVAAQPDLPVVIITGHDEMANVVQAIRAGAFEFIRKPVSIDELVEVAGRAVRANRRRLPETIDVGRLDGLRPPGIIGESPAMLRLFDELVRVSRADTTVVITGETGTGKELVARAVHELSARRDDPFVAVNCAAMTSSLLESELFGHAKGSFTDAERRRDGLFVTGNGGTVFLDEIGEMALDMQAKLLRVLQERRVRAVGESHEVPIDVRIIAATNRDLEHAVAEGRFREDIYYRLHVVALEVPPLRDRDRDVLLIARHLLGEIAGGRELELGDEVEELLLRYPWPGNVRELENVMTRAVAVCSGDRIEAEHLPPKLTKPGASRGDKHGAASTMPTLGEVERRYIAQVLDAVDGNKTSAARILGMNRRTLYRKLARYEQD